MTVSGSEPEPLDEEAWKEAYKRYDSDRIIDENTGEEISHDDWGYAQTAREAFIAGVKWAREHKPEEEKPSTPKPDAIGQRDHIMIMGSDGRDHPW